MVRKILDWCDEKYENEVLGDDRPISYVKAFGLGAIEGAIDGLVINGVLLIAAGTIATIIGKTNK